jgi:hypothetical protein
MLSSLEPEKGQHISGGCFGIRNTRAKSREFAISLWHIRRPAYLWYVGRFFGLLGICGWFRCCNVMGQYDFPRDTDRLRADETLHEQDRHDVIRFLAVSLNACCQTPQLSQFSLSMFDHAVWRIKF